VSLAVDFKITSEVHVSLTVDFKILPEAHVSISVDLGVHSEAYVSPCGRLQIPLRGSREPLPSTLKSIPRLT